MLLINGLKMLPIDCIGSSFIQLAILPINFVGFGNPSLYHGQDRNVGWFGLSLRFGRLELLHSLNLLVRIVVVVFSFSLIYFYLPLATSKFINWDCLLFSLASGGRSWWFYETTTTLEVLQIGSSGALQLLPSISSAI
jgi:hypothetical protein